MRVHVERQRDQVDIAGALAIAEQASLDPISACEQAELCRSDAAAAVVMGVEADDDAVTRRNVSAHPFDLVGIDVGHRCLDSGGEVEDQRLLRRGLQDGHHRLANLKAEFELGGGEGFGAIFEMPVGLGIFRGLFGKDRRALDRDRLYPCLVELEHDVAPCRTDRVIQMHDGAFCSRHAFEGALDQVAARLGQSLNDDIFGYASVVDEAAHEVEIGLACTRKANLDFFDADLY